MAKGISDADLAMEQMLESPEMDSPTGGTISEVSKKTREGKPYICVTVEFDPSREGEFDIGQQVDVVPAVDVDNDTQPPAEPMQMPVV